MHEIHFYMSAVVYNLRNTTYYFSKLLVLKSVYLTFADPFESSTANIGAGKTGYKYVSSFICSFLSFTTLMKIKSLLQSFMQCIVRCSTLLIFLLLLISSTSLI